MSAPLSQASFPSPPAPTSRHEASHAGAWASPDNVGLRETVFRQAMIVDALAVDAVHRDAPIAHELAAQSWTPWTPNLRPLSFDVASSALRQGGSTQKGVAASNWDGAQDLFVRCCVEGKLEFWTSVEEAFPRVVIERSKGLAAAWESTLLHGSATAIGLLLERSKTPHFLPNNAVKLWSAFLHRPDAGEAFEALWPLHTAPETAREVWPYLDGVFQQGVLTGAPAHGVVRVMERLRAWCAAASVDAAASDLSTAILEQLWSHALEALTLAPAMRGRNEEPQEAKERRKQERTHRHPTVSWLVDTMASEHVDLIQRVEKDARETFLVEARKTLRSRLENASPTKHTSVFLSTVAEHLNRSNPHPALWIRGIQLDEPRLIALSESLHGSLLSGFEAEALREHLPQGVGPQLRVPNPYPMLFKREEIRAKTGRRDVMEPAFERMRQRLNLSPFITTAARTQLLAVLDHPGLPPAGSVPEWISADKHQVSVDANFPLTLESVLWCLPVGPHPRVLQWVLQQEPQDRSGAAQRWEDARQLLHCKFLPRINEASMEQQYEASWERAQLFAQLTPSAQLSNRMSADPLNDENEAPAAPTPAKPRRSNRL